MSVRTLYELTNVAFKRCPRSLFSELSVKVVMNVLFLAARIYRLTSEVTF
jgi:hypothetical protein